MLTRAIWAAARTAAASYLVELPPVYPNGIAVEADGVVWVDPAGGETAGPPMGR